MPSGSEHLSEHLCKTEEEASFGAKSIDCGVSQANIKFLLHHLPAMGPETIYSDILNLYFFKLKKGIIIPIYKITLMF